MSAAQAAAVVTGKGYVPDVSHWRSGADINVVLGVFNSSADGYNQRAFFFTGSRFLGTDTADPSAGVAWVGRTAHSIRLRYELYASADAMCCPSLSAQTVTFDWDGSSLRPEGTIPSSAQRR
jgi:hypothetical protein